jgi:hypothetical protein
MFEQRKNRPKQLPSVTEEDDWKIRLSQPLNPRLSFTFEPITLAAMAISATLMLIVPNRKSETNYSRN